MPTQSLTEKVDALIEELYRKQSTGTDDTDHLKAIQFIQKVQQLAHAFSIDSIIDEDPQSTDDIDKDPLDSEIREHISNKRSRMDASNIAEFLDANKSGSGSGSSSSRTRTRQVPHLRKMDVMNSSNTLKTASTTHDADRRYYNSSVDQSQEDDTKQVITSNHDFGISERVKDIEDHIMSATNIDSDSDNPSLTDRIKNIEEWIVRMEETEPRLALKHFNAHKGNHYPHNHAKKHNSRSSMRPAGTVIQSNNNNNNNIEEDDGNESDSSSSDSSAEDSNSPDDLDAANNQRLLDTQIDSLRNRLDKNRKNNLNK